MMEKKTKNIYILTETGAAYNDEGVAYVLDIVRNKYHETAPDLSVNMGALYNDPKFMAKELADNPDSYIFVSTAQDIVGIHTPEGTGALIKNIKNHPEVTVWEAACRTYNLPKEA